MAAVFGIDLGTTYSCVAGIDQYGRPQILPNFDGDLTSPSVVLFSGPDDYVFGKTAKRQALIDPQNVCSLAKRHMGDPEWRFVAVTSLPPVAGAPAAAPTRRGWSARGISSLILRSLCTDAALSAGEAITDVVITVPAYFGSEERRATKEAGELAGLNVIDIINEPTAAALAYGLLEHRAVEGHGDQQNVLVYDLGGGTFDITIIALSEDRISVVATDGDHGLGGADWDERLAVELASRFRQACPGAGDPLDDSYATQQLLQQAEETKRSLSDRSAVEVLVSYERDRAGVTVSAEDFDSLTASLLQRTIDLTHSALFHARQRGIREIHQTLLVGGSSKMPAVARRLREEFGFDPRLADPDLSVAKGAALYGRKRQLEREITADLVAGGRLRPGEELGRAAPRDREAAIARAAEEHGLTTEAVDRLVTVSVVNVCSRGFGVVAVDDAEARYAHFLVHANDRLPVRVTERFGTVNDDQQFVRVVVFEQGGGSESRRLTDNNILMEGAIDGIPPGYPAGTEIEVSFSMAYDGILEVTASHVALDEPLRLRLETERGTGADADERNSLSALRRRDR